MPYWACKCSKQCKRLRNRSAIDAEAPSHARFRPEISCFSLLSAMHAASPEPPDGRHTVAKGTQTASVCATTTMIKAKHEAPDFVCVRCSWSTGVLVWEHTRIGAGSTCVDRSTAATSEPVCQAGRSIRLRMSARARTSTASQRKTRLVGEAQDDVLAQRPGVPSPDLITGWVHCTAARELLTSITQLLQQRARSRVCAV